MSTKPVSSDVDDAPDSEEAGPAASRFELDEGTRAGIRCAALWTGIVAIVIPFGVAILRPALAAGNELLSEKDEHWFSAMMPMTFFIIFGLAAGALVGWRLSASAGLIGRPGWLVGLGSAAGLALVAALAGIVLFASPVPMLFWVATLLLFASAAGAVSYFALWTE